MSRFQLFICLLVLVILSLGASTVVQYNQLWNAFHVDVSVQAGSDWTTQLTNALAQCPASKSCILDMSRVPGGVGVGGFTANRGALQVILGDGTYTIPDGQSFIIEAASGFISDIEVKGAGIGSSILSCIGSSVDPCVLVHGSLMTFGGERNFIVQDNVTAGGFTYSALDTDVVGTSLAAGDWVRLGDWAVSPNDKTFNDQRDFWAQVVSVGAPVAGNDTVTLNMPCPWNGNLQGRTVWSKFASGANNVHLHNFSIDMDGTRAHAALYVHDVRNPRLDNLGIYQNMASGRQAVAIYTSYDLSFHDNVIVSDSAWLESAATPGGNYFNNLFACGLVNANGTGIVFDFGDFNTVITGNYAACSNIGVLEADNIQLTNNTVVGQASGYGYSITGNDTQLIGNHALAFPLLYSVADSVQRSGIVAWTNAHSYTDDCVIENPDDGWVFCEQGSCTSGGSQPAWVETQAANYNYPTGIGTNDNTCTWYGDKYHTSSLAVAIPTVTPTPNFIAGAGLSVTNNWPASVEYDIGPTETATPSPTPTSTGTATPSPAPTAQHAGVGTVSIINCPALTSNVDAGQTCPTSTATATSTPSPTPTATATPAATATPLNVSFYVTPPSSGGMSSAAFANTLNKMNEWSPFLMPQYTVWSHICVFIATIDASNQYDIGIYNSAGTLEADIGAQTIPSANLQCFAIIANASCTGSGTPSSCCTGSGTGTCPTSVVSAPGVHRMITTGTATTAKLYYIATSNSTSALDVGSFSLGTTSNGILPSSQSPPAVAVSTAIFIPTTTLY